MTSVLRWFRSLVDVRRGERVTVALMFAYGFLALTSYYVIKPARNSIFLDRVGSDMLPLIYILTAIFIIAVMVVYSRYVEKIGRMTLLLGSMAFLVISLAGFWWILGGGSGFVSSGAFYIFVKLYPLLLVSQFWLVGNLLFTTTQARRLFGPIGVGLILGGIAGSGIAGGLADRMGTVDLLLVAGAILVACAGIVVALAPRMEKAEGTSARLTEELSGTAVQLLRSSSHLKTIAVILGLTIVVGTLLDWQLNRAVELEIAGEDAKTEFFGLFYGVLNVVSVSIQVLVTAAVLRRFGIRVALLVLPVGLALASAGVLIIPGLVTATLAKGAEGALRYSLDQSTRELLFLPVPEVVKYKVKPLIDLGVYRGGTGLGGLLLLLFVNGLGFSLRAISIVTLATIAFWLVAAIRMRREFGDSLRRLIGVRDVKLEELVVGRLDPSVWKEISRVLEKGDEQQIQYALALLEIDPTTSLADDVAPLLQHESPDIRAQAVRLLEEMEADAYMDEVRGLLEDDSLEVQSDAIQYLCRLDPDPVSDLERFLDDDSLVLRTAALGCLLRRRDEAGRSRGLDYVEELAGSDDPEERRQAARLLGEIDDPTDRAVDLLSELVQDPDVAVCHRAMEAAGRSGAPDLVPVLLDRLGDTDYRTPAAAALRAYGPAVHDELLDRMLDDETPTDVRAMIPSRLLPDPDDTAVRRMVEALPDLEAVVRYEVLKTLNKLRRREPERSFPDIDHDPLIERELELAHTAIALAHVLRQEDEDDLLLIRTLEERKLQAVERALRTIALQEPPGDLYTAFTALSTGDDEITRQRGYELMDTVLPQRFRALFATAVDPDTPEERRIEAAEDRYDFTVDDRDEALELLADDDDPWLALLARRARGDALQLGVEELELRLRAESLLAQEWSPPETEEELMEIVERAEHLARTEMFEDVRTEDLVAIATLAEEKEWEAEETLFREGVPGGTLHIVIDGRLEARKDGRVLFSAEEGGSVGSLSFLDGRPTDYEAVACTASRTLSLDREAFRDALTEREALVHGVLRYLAGVVRGLNEAPDQERQDDGNAEEEPSGEEDGSGAEDEEAASPAG